MLVKENQRLKKKIKKLENQLNFCELTKARSRFSYTEILKARDKELKLVLALDIRAFGDYNVRYGHSEGNKVLKMFVEKLQHIFRSKDAVYRWGGDEFVVILYGVTNLVAINRRLEEKKIFDIAYVGYAYGEERVYSLAKRAFWYVEEMKRINHSLK
ncbi:MAG: GGDEF domain-containing protein [Cyanobacteria bacterium P01_A01_bin.80]